MPTEEEIKRLAYGIWEVEGRPDGRDIEHYLKARQILAEQEKARVLELAPPSPVMGLASPARPAALPPAPDQVKLAAPPAGHRRTHRSKRR